MWTHGEHVKYVSAVNKGGVYHGDNQLLSSRCLLGTEVEKTSGLRLWENCC